MIKSANPGGSFWPWPRKTAIIAGPFILIALLFLVAVSRTIIGWPSPTAEGAVFTGVVLITLLPVLLMLLDHLAGNGGSVEAFGVHLSFAAEKKARQQITVPPRLGLGTGMVLNDSSTHKILDTLREALHNDVAVIDLEDGGSWWETRLLVLSAGAARLGRPNAIVFVAKIGNVNRVFQGWASASEVLRRLLEQRQDLRAAYDQARAIYCMWELANPALPPGTSMQSRFPFEAKLGPDTQSAMNTVPPNGVTKVLLASEQILALQLTTIESNKTYGIINATRLKELFDSVLQTQSIDLDKSESDNQWVQTVLSTTDSNLALTRNGQYAGLLPREKAINDILKALIATHDP